jgi:hypothetical protein
MQPTANEPGDAHQRPTRPALTDPIPDDVLARARAVFEQLAAPGDLAPLVYDSLAEGATGAGRFWLVFQHETAQLQLSITPRGNDFQVHGRIDPRDTSSRAELEIDHTEHAIVVPVRNGEFAFDAVAPGVMRVRLADPDGEPRLHTDWFLIGAHAQ